MPAMHIHPELTALVEATIDKVGQSIVLGAPLGIGKPHPLLNAFYRYASDHPEITLTIFTALSLNTPAVGSGLQQRFLQPFLERQFGAQYPQLDYVDAIQRNQVPDNISISEFYVQSGSILGKSQAQQNYLSSNYTHVARDMRDIGVNVICQLVAARTVDGDQRYSLSCNPDVTLDLADLLEARRDSVCLLGLVNSELPYMAGDAEVSADFFDQVIDAPELDYQPFAIPRAPVNTAEHCIGLYASTLIRDGGTLQIGIGALGDAICHALIQRHQNQAGYKAILNALDIPHRYSQLLAKSGETGSFQTGLYAASEMFMDGFVHLHEHGILKRLVYDDIGLQTVLNSLPPNYIGIELLQALASHGVIHHQLRLSDIDYLKYWGLLHADAHRDGDELVLGQHRTQAVIDNQPECKQRLQPFSGPGLRHGKRLHAAFFLGSRWFYQQLNAMPDEQRDEFSMTRVSRINQLYRGEALDRVQRHKARFINTCMKMTLLGAAVSDQLSDGQVVSGVGGQYNFVAMAHALDNSRSILMLRSVRNGSNGLESNIVWEYPHHTIPRHLRDIVITEYGIADLRGQSDTQCIQRLICIADSRFQQQLIQQARAAGKLDPDWQLPQQYASNTPAHMQTTLQAFDNHLPRWPFGSDLDAVEQQLAIALQWLKKRSKLQLVGLLCRPVPATSHYAQAMQRMALDQELPWSLSIQKRLLLQALKQTSEPAPSA